MTRILFIFPHFNPAEASENPYNAFFREVCLADQLSRLNFEVKIFFLSNESFNDSVFASFLPIAPPASASTDVESPSLVDAALAFAPRLIIVKGAGYKLTKQLWIKARARFKLAFIVGGGNYDYLFPIANCIFREFPGQRLYGEPFLANWPRNLFLTKTTVASAVGTTSAEKEFDIVSVGRLIPNKRHEALFSLAKKYKVVIIGDGPEYDRLTKLALVENVNITFTGHLSQVETARLISRSRLMVHPSCSEGYPRVFTEALSAGVPIVALEGVYGDFVRDQPGILLSAEQNLDRLVSALLRDDALLAALTSKAISASEEIKHSFKTNSVQFCMILKEVAEQNRSIFSSYQYLRFRCEIYYAYRRISYRVSKLGIRFNQ